MRTVLPRFYVYRLPLMADPVSWFGVRDRQTQTCSGQHLGIFAGLGLSQAIATAAHHNRHAK